MRKCFAGLIALQTVSGCRRNSHFVKINNKWLKAVDNIIIIIRYIMLLNFSALHSVLAHHLALSSTLLPSSSATDILLNGSVAARESASAFSFVAPG